MPPACSSTRRKELAEAGLNPDEAFIEHWTWHDLRRTAATRMARLKHPLHVVDKILNHSETKSGTGRMLNSVARIYIKEEFYDDQRKAMQDWGNWIRMLISQTGHSNRRDREDTAPVRPAL